MWSPRDAVGVLERADAHRVRRELRAAELLELRRRQDHPGAVGEQRQERRGRRLEVQAHRVRVDDLDRLHGGEIAGAARLLVGEVVLERRLDGLRVERRAVVEPDALLQRDRERLAVLGDRRQRGRELRDDLELRPDVVELLAHVDVDDPAHERAGRRRVERVGVLGEGEREHPRLARRRAAAARVERGGAEHNDKQRKQRRPPRGSAVYPSSRPDRFPLQTTAKLPRPMPGHGGRHFLQIPGPTNVPDRVLRALAAPTIDHRGPEFAALAARSCSSGLPAVFRTSGPVVVYPSSGTGAWEAALVNTLSPGRSRARVRDRPLRDAVARAGRAARPRASSSSPGDWRHGVDPERRDGASPPTARTRSAAVLRRPQRDLDRRHEPRRRGPRRRWTRPATTRCCSSTRSRRSARSTTATTSGAST